MVLIDKNDTRGPKAVALATDAGQWLKCRTRDGRKAYGVPSSTPGRYYLVTRTTCECPDFARGHRCKHVLAVEMHCQLAEQETTSAKADDIFARFEQDEDKAIARILNPKPAAWTRKQRGVIPAAQIERED